MLRHPQSGSYEALLPFAYQWFRWQTIAEAGLRRQKEAGGSFARSSIAERNFSCSLLTGRRDRSVVSR